MSQRSSLARLPLRRNQEFFLDSFRIDTQSLVAYVRQNDIDQVRVAIIVSKKIQTLSVHRNRLKRKLFSLLRENLSPKTALDIALRVKHSRGMFHEKHIYTNDIESIMHSVYTMVQNSATQS